METNCSKNLLFDLQLQIHFHFCLVSYHLKAVCNCMHKTQLYVLPRSCKLPLLTYQRSLNIILIWSCKLQIAERIVGREKYQ
jgi:hypothetical protein